MHAFPLGSEGAHFGDWQSHVSGYFHGLWSVRNRSRRFQSLNDHEPDASSRGPLAISRRRRSHQQAARLSAHPFASGIRARQPGRAARRGLSATGHRKLGVHRRASRDRATCHGANARLVGSLSRSSRLNGERIIRTMPGWLKVLLAIVGFFVLVIVVLGVVAYKSFRAHEPELRASAAKRSEERRVGEEGRSRWA